MNSFVWHYWKHLVRPMALPVLILVIGLMPARASAQLLPLTCLNTAGTPAPVVGVVAGFAKFRYVSGPGGGNDKFKLKTFKGSLTFPGAGFQFNPTTPQFDPVNIHDFFVTIYDENGLPIYAGNMAQGSFWTGPINPTGNVVRWKYNDPSASVGIRKAIVKHKNVPGINPLDFVLQVKKIVGKNATLTNVPFPFIPNGGEGLNVMEEVLDTAGMGVCELRGNNGGPPFSAFGGGWHCVNSGNTVQKCK